MPKLEEHILDVIKNRKKKINEDQMDSPTRVKPEYDDLGGPITKPTDGKIDLGKAVSPGQAKLPPMKGSDASPVTNLEDPEAKYTPNKVRGKDSGSGPGPANEEDEPKYNFDKKKDDEDDDEDKKEVEEAKDDEDDDDGYDDDERHADRADQKEEKNDDGYDDDERFADPADEKPVKEGKKLKEAKFKPRPETGKPGMYEEEDDEDKLVDVLKDKEDDKKDDKDMQEDINAVFAGVRLTESGRKKAKTVFEAAVRTRVARRATRLQEKFEKQLNKRVATIRESLTKKTNAFMEYVAETWLKENEVAITKSIQADLAEDFLVGLKSLFSEHYVEIPKDKVNIVHALAEELEETKKKLNAAVAVNSNLRESVSTRKKVEIISEVTKGLPTTQSDKIRSLAEKVDFKSEKQFKEAVQTLRESYTQKSQKKSQNLTEEMGTDSAIDSGEPTKGLMGQYLSSLDKLSEKPAGTK